MRGFVAARFPTRFPPPPRAEGDACSDGAPQRGHAERAKAEALRRTRPRPDVPAIIQAIEQAGEVVAVMRADRNDPDSVRETMARCSTIAGRLHDALGAVNLAGGDLVAAALVRLRYAPHFLDRLAEGLDMLTEVLEAAQPRRRPAKRPKGAGRVPGLDRGVTNWLAAEVARILQAHDVRPSRHRDGVYADVLRAVWPALLGVEAPSEIQHLLRSVPTRPR